MGMYLGTFGYSAFGVASLIVSLHLLWLWRKSRQLPELLLGVGLLTSFISQVFTMVAAFPGLAEYPPLLVLVHRCFYVTKSACVAIMVWRVFRPTERWARLLVALMLSQLTTFILRDLILGPIEYGELVRHPLYWWDTCGQIAPFVWASLEALRLQNDLRRRWQIGLEPDRRLGHRMLLWGIGFAAMAVLYSIYEIEILATLILGGVVEFRSHLLLVFVLGMISAGALWLAFFPPLAYLRRVGALNPRHST